MTTMTATHGPSTLPAKAAAGPLSFISRRTLGVIVGLLLFGTMLSMAPPAGMPEKAWSVAAVGVLMAFWWVFEALPIPVTALVPLALFPILGVSPIKATAAPYANPLIFLFLGGFVIALAMERWNLHRRIALGILSFAGPRPAALVGGFMGATAFLSMWVSNTATATMMLPIGLSVIALVVEAGKGKVGACRAEVFTPALLLGIAYGASIGGVATLIGTPPNALMAGFMSETYGVEIGFGQWMMVGLPVSAALMVVAWLALTRFVFPLRNGRIDGAADMIEQERKALGSVSRGEFIIGTIFVLTAISWIFRPLINDLLPGLHLSDPVIAIVAALVVFTIPVDSAKKVFLLDWKVTQKLPWGVLLLFGGGLSLGAAINASGLSGWIATAMGTASDWPILLMILGVSGVVMLISHLTSNTATAAAFLPLVAALAISLGQNPLLLAVPTVLAASCVFMMPVATPPNAIVFASGSLTVPQMVRAGFVINIVALGLIVIAVYALMLSVFGVEFGVLPDWALAK
jgi:solute carrier family 13 (sodium-dependent dicarboxylate transporter), member 2/3/5